MKLGIIREGKIPPDSRVPLTPKQCQKIIQTIGVNLLVERSSSRCYQDAEYEAHGINLSSDMTDCQLLLGIKEVPIEQLIPDKTYLFFSHTIKKQPYNRKLLQAVLQKNIKLVDYEVLTDDNANRLIAFGFFAGMVGAHNGIWTYGKRTGLFDLPRMKDMYDYAAAKAYYETVIFPNFKVVVTGTGRVGQGAVQVLKDMGIQQISPSDFLNASFKNAVFTHLSSEDYVTSKDGSTFDKKHFYKNPDQYQSDFLKFAQVADILVHGIYWDNRAPALFTTAEMCRADFNIQVIADVTCDIAPQSSIPSTLKASTIADPVFGYNPTYNMETPPFQSNSVDVMSIDNLPSEMPRDASESFGNQFMNYILPELLKTNSEVIERATIAKDGKLMPRFAYLQDYVDG